MLDYKEDWEIITMHKQYRRLTQNYELDKPVWLGDTRYDLKRESLLEGKLQVYMPSSFMQLSEEAAKEKYPSMNRPQIVVTNEDRTVDFTFNHVEKTVLPLTSQTVWAEVDRLFPRSVLYDTGAFKSDGLEILWLEYKSFSLTSEVYNILFPIMSVTVGTVIGTFSCPIITYDIWKPCVMEIIKTIHIQEVDNEGF